MAQFRAKPGGCAIGPTLEEGPMEGIGSVRDGLRLKDVHDAVFEAVIDLAALVMTEIPAVGFLQPGDESRCL